MKKYKKIPVTSCNIQLGTYPVYSEKIYWGHEPFKVTGITEDEIQIEGDFSGIGHSIVKGWVNIKDLFMLSTVCEEQIKPEGCQVHNIYCCGGGSITTKHIDKYWEHMLK